MQGDRSPSANSNRQFRGDDPLEASLRSTSMFSAPSGTPQASIQGMNASPRSSALEARDASPRAVSPSSSRVEFGDLQELNGRQTPTPSTPVQATSSPRQSGQISFGRLAAVTAAAVGAAAKARAVVGPLAAQAQPAEQPQHSRTSDAPAVTSQPSSVVVPALAPGPQHGQCQIALPPTGTMLSPRTVASPPVAVPQLQMAPTVLHSPRMPPGVAPLQAMQPAVMASPRQVTPTVPLMVSPRQVTPTPGAVIASAPAAIRPGYMYPGVTAGYQPVRQ